ncbi:MAG: S41 family peptidase [Patescibacteria group bacterium]
MKYRIIIFVSSVLALLGAFGGGWYARTVIATEPSGAMAGLIGSSDCTGSNCGLSSMVVIPNIINTAKGKPGNVDFSPFWKTWQILNERYVNTHVSTTSTTTKVMTDQDRVWGAISGLVASFGDSYTVFLPPQENKQFNDDIKGNFGGVGMEMGYKDKLPTVIAPLPDSPAKAAGIKAGDKVIKVDNTATLDVPLDETINKIRGEVGTMVTLTILRDNVKNPFEVKIVRATINIPTLDTKIINGQNANDKIFVINLYNFSSQSANLFRDAIQKFSQSGAHKLILDLRGNPGGYLESAVDIASWFLPPGDVVVRESRGAGKNEKVYRSSGYKFNGNSNLKMMILVDGGSASAAEILAGALAEHGKAKLIGEKTFGKGSVQELIPVTKDSSVKVTIARWLTPNGKSISQNGLDPDYPIKVATDAEQIVGKDPQMDKAVELLKAAN